MLLMVEVGGHVTARQVGGLYVGLGAFVAVTGTWHVLCLLCSRSSFITLSLINFSSTGPATPSQASPAQTQAPRSRQARGPQTRRLGTCSRAWRKATFMCCVRMERRARR